MGELQTSFESAGGLREAPHAPQLLCARLVAIGDGCHELMGQAVAELERSGHAGRVELVVPQSPPAGVRVELTEPDPGLKQLAITVSKPVDRRWLLVINLSAAGLIALPLIPYPLVMRRYGLLALFLCSVPSPSSRGSTSRSSGITQAS